MFKYSLNKTDWCLKNKYIKLMVRGYGRETYIIQDCEGLCQSFAQQPNPFGKQFIQMFTEMLIDNQIK